MTAVGISTKVFAMSQPESPSEEPAKTPADSDSEEGEKPSPKELSAEEQMAAYEESLKETDWGHQPC